VVIIGCGFGGLFAAKALKRAPVRVTLIDRTNHHLFQPLLYQVATGILSEGQIARPSATCCATSLAAGGPGRGGTPSIRRRARSRPPSSTQTGHLHLRQPHRGRRRGDAPTSATTSSAAAACGMKSLDDALYLRGQIFGAFERPRQEEDEERGGPS
jgi:NADH dehydrogenase